MSCQNSTPPHGTQGQDQQQEERLIKRHTVSFTQIPSTREGPPPRILAPTLQQLAHFHDMNQARATGGEWKVVERPLSIPSPPLRNHTPPPRHEHPSRSRQYFPSSSASSLDSHGLAPSIAPSTDYSDARSSPSSPEIVSRPASMQSWYQGPNSSSPSPPPSVAPSLPPFDKALEKGLLKIERAGLKVAKGAKSLWGDVEKGVGKMAWRVGRGRKLKKRVHAGIEAKDRKTKTN